MSSLVPRGLTAALALFGFAAAPATIDASGAAKVFAEANAICGRDHGALWGRSLCGPVMLVAPADRSIVANQADTSGVLKPSGRVFVGVLPASDNIANTAVDWSGMRWTEMIWPISADADARRVTIAHELFHRIQPDLAVAKLDGGDNRHLDTLEGRYLLQLEWRALAAALKAPRAHGRRAAVADALLFRARRYAIFPRAASEETALELNEGLAEYTGVRLGLRTIGAQTGFALRDLEPRTPNATFVRSFAYATGPAYGLLLDEADPAWRTRLGHGQGFDQLLRAAMRLPEPDLAAVDARAAAYDEGALRAVEVKRDAEMRASTAALAAKLVEGPVLTLPMRHANFGFNPQTLRPLAPFGTVYPTLRLVDDWGVLDIEKDALMADDMKTAAVSAAGIDPSGLQGPGWRLTLKPGWAVRPGARTGDVVLEPTR